MNNLESIDYIEKFLKEGHIRLTKKSKRYNYIGDIALILTIFSPLLIFGAMMIFTDIAIIKIIILAIATIPILIFIAFVTYFLSEVEPVVFKDDVIIESLKYYKGVENLRPSVIKGLNSEIINKKFEKYMIAKNLSLGEQEVFDQLSSENFQGSVADLITVCKNINKS
jgi:hypothetical protein